ncbi:hepcidin-like [Melanotaenia boesemani]|uniref:hepcidin-like n=1 Tax=Melanotaenia boesemani TaxID=1250792 RepID=UPI001C045F65|nr:hepcidin-like [Melanotaenia boesemani]
MKTFSVAVAVAVMLTFICVQKSSADRSVGSDEWWSPIEPVAQESLVAAGQEMPMESWKIPYEVRQKRHAAAKCRFCCNCCPNMSGCGICCRF